MKTIQIRIILVYSGAQALAQVRAANASCATFFYLNSLVDFTALKLHQQPAAGLAARGRKPRRKRYSLAENGISDIRRIYS